MAVGDVGLLEKGAEGRLSLRRNVLKVAEQEDGRGGGVCTQNCEERGTRADLAQTSSSEGPRGQEQGGGELQGGLWDPREALVFGMSWLSPCRRASKKIREPAALAKVLGEGSHQVCKVSTRPCQVPGSALSSPCHSAHHRHPLRLALHSSAMRNSLPAPNLPRNPVWLPGLPWGFCKFLKVKSNKLFWDFLKTPYPSVPKQECERWGGGWFLSMFS